MGGKGTSRREGRGVDSLGRGVTKTKLSSLVVAMAETLAASFVTSDGVSVIGVVIFSGLLAVENVV